MNASSLSLARLPLLRNPLQRRVHDRHGFPVLPGRFPLIGHFPVMALQQLELMRDAKRRVGDLFWVELNPGFWTLVCVHEEAFQLFRNKVTTSEDFRSYVGDLFGESMIVHDGAKHHHMRGALNGPFSVRGLDAAAVGELFADTMDRAVRRLGERREVRILSATREIVLSLMFRMLGVPEQELSAWRVQYEELMMLAVAIRADLPGFPLRRGLRARAWLDERLRAIIAEARRDPSATGLLAQMVRSRDEGGVLLNERELLDNLRLLILAGHETSATTMAWMTLTLAERPDLWSRLCEEARGRAVPRSPAELRAFPFAEAMFRETLRMYPPVCFDGRMSTANIAMAGRTIPPGTRIGVSVLLLSRSPALHDSPDTFRPERWLDRREPVTPVELVPFGGGPHFCLGYHLAWMEIVQFAVTLAHIFGERGMRPTLVGAPPEMIYVPLLHPSSRSKVTFV
jgi:cytochrome P450